MNHFLKILKDNGLSEDNGFKIRNHLVEALKNNELSLKSVKTRCRYLIENIDKVDDNAEKTTENICPFCGSSDNPDYIKYCNTCGNAVELKKNNSIESIFDYEEDIEEIDSILDDEKSESKEIKNTSQYVKYADDYFIHPDDETFDFIVYYDKCMLDFDRDEFFKYYIKHSDEASIEEIGDIFVEEKLADATGSDECFMAYFDYLIHFMYYNLHFGDLCTATMYFCQFIILVVNKSKPGTDIIWDNPYAYDIDVFSISLIDKEFDCDIEKSITKAFDEFKFSQWANNKEILYEVIPEIFEI